MENQFFRDFYLILLRKNNFYNKENYKYEKE